MKAEIISIGTELLLGQIVDTNAAYLASQLPALGIDLYYISQVGDNQERLVDTLRRAVSRSDLVLTTGGLGPTEDDVTRESIAALCQQQLSQDPALATWIDDFFKRRGRQMSANNLKQAMLIPAAKPLVNERGTAPGWWVEQGGFTIIAMPGPPHECHFMWETQVKPFLAAKLTSGVIVSRTLKVWGLPESTVDEMIAEHLRSSNPTIGVYAKRDGIHLRLTAKAPAAEAGYAMIDPLEKKLRAILGDSVWGSDDETLEGLVSKRLQALGFTLAVMESCTGGLLASAITDVPGSSRYFKGGLVSYAIEAKRSYGVPAAVLEKHGAVSSQTAEAMAVAACAALGADVGVATTGVAGPDAMEGKQVGTVYVAVAAKGQVTSSVHLFPGPREMIKARATVAALYHLVTFLSTLTPARR